MVRTVLAYLATYLLWGATFLGIRIAVQTMPPFAMAGSRFLLAGIIVSVLVAFYPKGRRLSWPKATITGALFTLGTHGIISHISRDVPSGTVAVMMATVPLMAATGGWFVGGERPGAGLMLGLGLGFGGVALLAWPGGLLSPWQASWLLLAALCWTIGSILTQRWGDGLDKVPMAGRQMLAGGSLLMLASGLSGQGWVPAWPGWEGALAVLYLAVGGTILAYFGFLHLMSKTTVTKASSYTFVNPLVAVLLGWAFGGELVTARLLLATPFILAAVVMVLRSRDQGALEPEGPSCRLDARPT